MTGVQTCALPISLEAGFVFWGDEYWKPHGQLIDWSSNYDWELEKFAQILMERMKNEKLKYVV